MGSIDNIVANGTIFETDLDSGNMKVSIDVVLDGDCQIPFSSKKEGNILSQEIGSHLLWPRELVIADNGKEPKMDKKQSKKSKKMKKVLNKDAMAIMESAPISLRCLLREVEHSGSAIQIHAPIEVFGIKMKIHIMLEVLQAFCEVHEIATACLDVYMMHLYKYMKKTNASGTFKFLDAGSISESSFIESRVELLTARLLTLEENQILLFPYNIGHHWVLIVIDHSKDLAFCMDPLRKRLYPDIANVVGRAFNAFKKTKPTWKRIKCPMQPGTVECGYYVMRFMRHIIHHPDRSITDIMKDAPSSYTQEDIDVVRTEWGEFVIATHIFCK